MADIVITDLTDGSLDINNDWAGTGVFDKLIEAVNKNIEGQYNKGRISGSDYANVYLGSMQSVLAQSMEFLLREKLVEAQIQDTEASVALKENQLEVDKSLAEAQLEQQWGYEVTRDGDNNLVLGATTGAGKIDKEKIVLDEQKETSDIEQALLDYELASTKPAQLADILKTTDVKERQMVEAELTGAKQRTLLDTEEQAKQYEVDNILPEQLTKIQEEIDLLQTQDSELLLNGTVDRSLKNKELEVTEVERLAKQYEVDNILPEQLTKIQEEIDLLETQDSELTLNGVKDRLLKDKQIEKVQEEINTEEYGQTALAARVYDETSIKIDESNLTYPVDDQDTKHYWALKAAEADVVGKKQETALVANKVKTEEANTKMTIGKMLQEYGMQASVTTYDFYDANGNLISTGTLPEPSGTVTKVPNTYTITMDGLSAQLAAPNYETGIPTTLLEAQLMKSATERDVSKRTSEGFAADTYYKVYRSLQELMFALTNSGIITEEGGGIYDNIVSAMEAAMNAQIDVWDTSIPNVNLN
jgi:hypothetical protein